MSYLNKLKLISEAQPAMQPNKKKVPGATKPSSKKGKDPEKAALLKYLKDKEDRESKPDLGSTFSSSAKTAFTSPEEIGSKLGGGALGHTLGTARTLAGAAAGVAKPLVSAGLKTAGKYIKKGFTSLFSKAKGKPVTTPTKNPATAPTKKPSTTPNVTPQQAYDYMKDVGRSMKRTARAEAFRSLGNLDPEARRKAAAELKSQRQNNPNASSADVRRAAYSRTGEVLGDKKMRDNMKKNLRGAALTSSNKKFDKKVGIPLRKAMEYAHRINSYQGTLIQEMSLSYINLFKNVN